MANHAVLDRIVQNLAFEVEAVPIRDAELVQASKSVPMSVKIRVRKKNELFQMQEVTSMTKLEEAVKFPDKIRLACSDETIMSFNVCMEDDYQQKNMKKQRNVLKKIKPGICLGVVDDEDYTYLPTTSYSAKMVKDRSHPNEQTKQKFILSKNNYQAPTVVNRTPTNFFGKCKPGGCLDPPTNEDIYSYKPTVIVRKSDDTKNIPEEPLSEQPVPLKIPNGKTTQLEDPVKENRDDTKIRSDDKDTGRRSSIFSSNLFKKKRKSSQDSDEIRSISMIDKIESTTNSLNHQENPILTYPSDFKPKSPKVSQEKYSGSNENNSILSFNEFSETYYMPSKRTNRSIESASSLKRDKKDSKVQSNFVPIPIPVPLPNTRLRAKSSSVSSNQSDIIHKNGIKEQDKVRKKQHDIETEQKFTSKSFSLSPLTSEPVSAPLSITELDANLNNLNRDPSDKNNKPPLIVQDKLREKQSESTSPHAGDPLYIPLTTTTTLNERSTSTNQYPSDVTIKDRIKEQDKMRTKPYESESPRLSKPVRNLLPTTEIKTRSGSINRDSSDKTSKDPLKIQDQLRKKQSESESPYTSEPIPIPVTTTILKEKSSSVSKYPSDRINKDPIKEQSKSQEKQRDSETAKIITMSSLPVTSNQNELISHSTQTKEKMTHGTETNTSLLMSSNLSEQPITDVSRSQQQKKEYGTESINILDVPARKQSDTQENVQSQLFTRNSIISTLSSISNLQQFAKSDTPHSSKPKEQVKGKYETESQKTSSLTSIFVNQSLTEQPVPQYEVANEKQSSKLSFFSYNYPTKPLDIVTNSQNNYYHDKRMSTAEQFNFESEKPTTKTKSLIDDSKATGVMTNEVGDITSDVSETFDNLTSDSVNYPVKLLPSQDDLLITATDAETLLSGDKVSINEINTSDKITSQQDENKYSIKPLLRSGSSLSEPSITKTSDENLDNYLVSDQDQLVNQLNYGSRLTSTGNVNYEKERLSTKALYSIEKIASAQGFADENYTNGIKINQSNGYEYGKRGGKKNILVVTSKTRNESKSGSLKSDDALSSDIKTKENMKINSEFTSIDIAFHSFTNHENKRNIRSFDPNVEPKRYKNDTLMILKSSHLKESSEEIRIPVDSEHDVSIQIKKVIDDPDANKIDNETEVTSEHNVGNRKRKPKQYGVAFMKNTQYTTKGHPERTLVKLYEQELIPLQGIIKQLKNEIHDLATQQARFREKIYESKIIKLPVTSNKTCGCVTKRKYLETFRY